MGNSQSRPACRGNLQGGLKGRSISAPLETKARGIMFLLLVTAVWAGPSVIARSQSLPYVEPSSSTGTSTASVQPDLMYTLPTQRTKVNNFVFDAFGPYPVVGAGLAAGINQWSNSPPEWNQGIEGYSKRFGSNFAIAAVSTTTRYGLSEAFKEDALYYRCDCRGVFPRLSHAMISTLTARRGQDGHRVFSFPALIGPYAGSMTAVYGWYPNRYGAKDAFRTGNYSLLTYMGGNIALEFFYSGPHSLLHRMHLNNAHGSPVQGPNR
jgi:hypothetical protein